MLSKTELWDIFTGAKKPGMREGEADDAGLRAVAEAAVKDAASDWCVSDSVMAGRIMNVFGRAHDPSLEPAADPFRDKIAAMIYQHRNAVKDAVGGEAVAILNCGEIGPNGEQEEFEIDCEYGALERFTSRHPGKKFKLYTRSQASAAVPERFVLVPRTLTGQMVDASGCDCQPGKSAYEVAQRQWDDMLAASEEK